MLNLNSLRPPLGPGLQGPWAGMAGTRIVRTHPQVV